MIKTHSFHIPVMGTGFTIDTPVKVAHFGIDSVVSLLDDMLMEKMRKMYCQLFSIPYTEITAKMEDHRAQRITSYLNLMHDLAKNKFEDLKKTTNDNFEDLKKYFEMLPDHSMIKQDLENFSNTFPDFSSVLIKMKELLKMGSIDVNIMTKLDRTNFFKGKQLSDTFNDAHAAVRGFVNSKLKSSLVFSAGLNPKLYSYLEHFDDFFPDKQGNFKKKIVLKVSDYRSALVQGKFLAKKGLWISEFRIESGLNCGGHAFARDGFLLGPILEEFTVKRDDLQEALRSLFEKAIVAKNRELPDAPLSFSVSAQGGVGTAAEHQFLLEHYNLSSVGWGSPFLLAPDITNVDSMTLKTLISAGEDDVYLSNISPLGIPFYTLKGNSKEIEKQMNIDKETPGSSCPKHYATFNKEFDAVGLCPASRKFQNLKLNQLKKEHLAPEEYQREYEKIIEKSCICVGLGTSALLCNQLDTTDEGVGVSVCPGPNLPYFNKVTDLKEMTDHIYGRTNILETQERPNLFIKELHVYLTYLKVKIEEAKLKQTEKQAKFLLDFAMQLDDGITYYENMFPNIKGALEDIKFHLISELHKGKRTLGRLIAEINELSLV